ncbi:MAG TPA: HD-GYP domain-containing protein [Clostridia bacterium]|nr:HD-GYP domain-containing protein [Clostridia bacterium]
MYRIPVDALQPGMKIARAVFTSDGHVLINQGVVLKQSYINHLRRFGIASVYVEDALALDLAAEDVIDEATRIEAVKTVRDFFVSSRQNGSGRCLISTRKLEETVNHIIEDLLSQRNLMVNLQDIRAMDDYTFGHSVNVCVLSLVAGIGLGFSRTQLMHLGMGALMHDIGKLKIPPSIMNKPGKLTDEEFAVMKQHTTFGYELLRHEVSLLTAHIALEHHERFDGAGYPNRISGNDIHLFSRICSVADVFDALTADRVYRKAYPPHEAYEYLAASGGSQFDYHVVNAFLRNVAAYPTGTWVELNTREIGVVVETKPGFATRPLVRLCFGPAPEREQLRQPEDVDLTRVLDRLITRVVPREEVEKTARNLPRLDSHVLK